MFCNDDGRFGKRHRIPEFPHNVGFAPGYICNAQVSRLKLLKQPLRYTTRGPRFIQAKALPAKSGSNAFDARLNDCIDIIELLCERHDNEAVHLFAASDVS